MTHTISFWGGINAPIGGIKMTFTRAKIGDQRIECAFSFAFDCNLRDNKLAIRLPVYPNKQSGELLQKLNTMYQIFAPMRLCYAALGLSHR